VVVKDSNFPYIATLIFGLVSQSGSDRTDRTDRTERIKAKEGKKAKKDVCIACKFHHDSFGWFCRYLCSTLINHDNYVSPEVIFD